MSSAPYLPARYYALLMGRLSQWGLDVPALLRDAGVRPEALASADGQLRPEDVETLASLAIARCGRTDLGFEMGRLLKVSSHDILGYAMLSAPTLDAALRLAARFFSLITPSYQMRYRLDAEGADMHFVPRLPLSGAVLNLHQEAIAVALVEHMKSLRGGQAVACRLYFSAPEPPHRDRYRELHGAQTFFGQEGLPGLHARVAAAVMREPLPLADAGTLAHAEQRCAALLATITRDTTLADWVRMMLREAADGAHALGELAAILNVSPRTLERRLHQEGVRFRELANEATHQRAMTLLAAGQLSVTQIAYQLGYEDPANFTRAFRRLAGCAPAAWQRRAHATQQRP